MKTVGEALMVGMQGLECSEPPSPTRRQAAPSVDEFFKRPSLAPSVPDVLDAVRLCIGSYQDRPHVTGWKPLCGTDLALPAEFGDAVKYRHGNAEAYVRLGAVGDARTVAVVFKGTDIMSIADWADNVIGIDRHYDRMRPLVEAIGRYIRTRSIDRVLVAGHSLGGAMAERFMMEHVTDDGGPAYVGVTFGSPGTRAAKGVSDLRLIEFRHAEDPVPKAGSLPLLAAYHVPGRIVTLDDRADHEVPLLGAIKAHAIAEYANSIRALDREGLLAGLLNRSTTVEQTVSFGGVASWRAATLAGAVLDTVAAFGSEIGRIAEQPVEDTMTLDESIQPDTIASNIG